MRLIEINMNFLTDEYISYIMHLILLNLNIVDSYI
jgi:hypothetical protein